MNVADESTRDGLIAELESSGEIVEFLNIAPGINLEVAATINRQPASLEMMEQGYRDKEPISVQVLKGDSESSIETIFIEDRKAALDLRALTPRRLSKITIDGSKRQIETIQDGGAFWTILTFKSNARQTELE